MNHRHPRFGTRRLAVLGAAVLVLLSACGSSSRHSAATATSAASSIDGSGIARLAALAGPAVALKASDLRTASGQKSFLEELFADLQTTWNQSFLVAALRYVPARLELIDSEVSTACGRQSSEVGPFYCSRDHTVYLNVAFFRQLELQFSVSGHLAEAFVVAHEFGHHVQNLLSITSRLDAADTADPARKNARSVLFELQADCLAGVWAHSAYARSQLAPLDVKQALAAAEVLGDDYLARASGSTVDPDSWTHGSSAQREHWVETGYKDGRASTCDTFGRP